MKRAESTACVNGALRGVVDRYSRINDRWRCATVHACALHDERLRKRRSHTLASRVRLQHSLHCRPPPGLLRVVTIISLLLTERPSQFYRMDQILINGIGMNILRVTQQYSLRIKKYIDGHVGIKC